MFFSLFSVSWKCGGILGIGSVCWRPHHDPGFFGGRLDRTPLISRKICRVRFRLASLEVLVPLVIEEFEMGGPGPYPPLRGGAFIVGSMDELMAIGVP